MAKEYLTKKAAEQAWLHLQQACFDANELEQQLGPMDDRINALFGKLQKNMSEANEWLNALKQE